MIIRLKPEIMGDGWKATLRGVWDRGTTRKSAVGALALTLNLLPEAKFLPAGKGEPHICTVGSGRQGRGQTPHSALGDLICEHGKELLGIEIETEPRSRIKVPFKWGKSLHDIDQFPFTREEVEAQRRKLMGDPDG